MFSGDDDDPQNIRRARAHRLVRCLAGGKRGESDACLGAILSPRLEPKSAVPAKQRKADMELLVGQGMRRVWNIART
jgi:hypothetical protein